MNCRRVRDEWHDVCDAGAAPMPEFDAHVRDCEPCRRYVRQMSRLVGALDELHHSTAAIVSRSPGDAGGATIRRAIPKWHRVTHALMRVAAVLVIVVGAGLYVRHRPSTQPVVQKQTPPVPTRRVSLELRGASDKALLAVREETSVENDEPVDVIWLYRLPPEKQSGDETPRSSTEHSRKEKRT
jgi:hypothetical protein